MGRHHHQHHPNEPEKKSVRVMLVKMRCPRCSVSTTMTIPVGGPPMCPNCGRPWFWPYRAIYKENEAWARGFVEKVEATFKPLPDERRAP